MNNRTLIRLALAALATVTVAAPALATHTGEQPPAGCRYIRGTDTPEDHDDDVYVCRQDVWIHKGSSQVGNLAGQGQSTLPSWNTTKPTGPTQDAGVYATSAEYDFLTVGDPTGRATFSGSFTGTLDTLAFQVYLRDAFNEANGASLGAEIFLSIDGQVVHDNFDTGGIDLPMKIFGNYRRVDATFLNVYEQMKSLELDLSSTRQHTVQLGLVGWDFPAESVFLYDAADLPSGLIFNLESNMMGGYTKIDLMPVE